jgi:hypothetical protein
VQQSFPRWCRQAERGCGSRHEGSGVKRVRARCDNDPGSVGGNSVQTTIVYKVRRRERVSVCRRKEQQSVLVE